MFPDDHGLVVHGGGLSRLGVGDGLRDGSGLGVGTHSTLYSSLSLGVGAGQGVAM